MNVIHLSGDSFSWAKLKSECCCCAPSAGSGPARTLTISVTLTKSTGTHLQPTESQGSQNKKIVMIHHFFRDYSLLSVPKIRHGASTASLISGVVTEWSRWLALHQRRSVFPEVSLSCTLQRMFFYSDRKYNDSTTHFVAYLSLSLSSFRVSVALSQLKWRKFQAHTVKGPQSYSRKYPWRNAIGGCSNSLFVRRSPKGDSVESVTLLR